MASRARSVGEVIRNNPQASGFAIIISNDYASYPKLETLRGTAKDAEKIHSTFQVLNIATHSVRNVRKPDLTALLSEAAECKYYPEHSKCIAFVFSGHGYDGNHIYMQDGNLMKIEDIVRPFLPGSAPMIGNIPKLFLIDACRGDQQLQAAVIPRAGGGKLRKGGTDVTLQVPAEGNFLVAHSTMPGFQSYELKGEGGIWMAAVAKKLRTSQESVEDVLTEVNEELMEKYQTPEWRHCMQQPEKVSRLNRRVYLSPRAPQPVPTKVECTGPQASPGAAKKTTAKATTAKDKSPKQTTSRKAGAGSSPQSSKPKTKPTQQSSTQSNMKDILSSHCTEHGKPPPSYDLQKTPDKCYEATVYVARSGRTKGSPKANKHQAEEDAAMKALEKLRLL